MSSKRFVIMFCVAMISYKSKMEERREFRDQKVTRMFKVAMETIVSWLSEDVCVERC